MLLVYLLEKHGFDKIVRNRRSAFYGSLFRYGKVCQNLLQMGSRKHAAQLVYISQI